MENEKVKEIKQALECCINNKGCRLCARGKLPYDLDECRLVLTNDILTLINELEKGNKILRGAKNRLTFAERIKLVNKAKEKAFKQFAEKLKKKTRVIVNYYSDHADKCFNGISEKEIDEILKEFLK